MHQISQENFYISGAARFSYLIYLVIKDRGLADQDIEHSRFIAFQRDQLAHMADKNWSSIAICVAKKPVEKMIAIGEDGEVFTYVGGTSTDEVIQPQPVCLRGMGVVDGYPLACGMQRQVYKRIDENSWLAMHAPSPEQGANAGFEAISGFSESEIYAVGWDGEIWQWDNSKWMNRTSPTNFILTGVCCAGNGKVYICGQNGTLLGGRDDLWELIELEDILDDFWDVCWFKDRLYITTMTMIFEYSDAGLIPVNFGEDRPGTCYALTQAEGVLWSVGSNDVFSFDGSTWTRID